MNKRLFKVLATDLWNEAESAGQFKGSGIDLADGFIHLSAHDQVVETVEKHFAGQTDLVIVEVLGDKLGDTLVWETSRGGALFPHVYGHIPIDAVLRVDPLVLDEDGKHLFPDHIIDT